MQNGSRRWALALQALLGLIVVVTLAVGQSVKAADQGSPGPLATAAQIHDARGAPQGDELLLTFDRSIEGPEGTKTDAWQVVLGPDYFAVREGEETQLFDFKFHWVTQINHARGEFLPNSLYGLVAFLDMETKNRVVMAEMGRALDAQGVDTRDKIPVDPFWHESELGIEVAVEADRDLAREEDGQAVVFRHAGREVVRYLLSDETLPPTAFRTFARFVRHSLNVHPRIASALIEQGRLPTELTFSNHAPGGSWSTTRLTLTAMSTRPAAYPLPRHAKGLSQFEETKFFEEDGFFARLLPTMIEAVNGTYDDGMLPPEWYVEEMVRAAEAGDLFDAGLLFLELGTMHLPYLKDSCGKPKKSNPSCLAMKATYSEAVKDQRFRRMLAAIDLEQKGKPLDALAKVKTIGLDDADHRHVVDRTIAISAAAAIKAQGPSQVYSHTAELRGLAETSLERALLGNPYMPNLYYDIGDYLGTLYQTPSAWLVFDLGRSLPAGPGRSLLDQVEKREAQLRQRHSQFF